jgi:hypothetical protein
MFSSSYSSFVFFSKKTGTRLLTAQSTYICRVQSCVWRLPKYCKILTPHPPLHPASVSSPHTRRATRGWGVNILKDAGHWIGLLQYNLYTGESIFHEKNFLVHLKRACLKSAVDYGQNLAIMGADGHWTVRYNERGMQRNLGNIFLYIERKLPAYTEGRDRNGFLGVKRETLLNYYCTTF